MDYRSETSFSRKWNNFVWQCHLVTKLNWLETVSNLFLLVWDIDWFETDLLAFCANTDFISLLCKAFVNVTRWNVDLRPGFLTNGIIFDAMDGSACAWYFVQLVWICLKPASTGLKPPHTCFPHRWKFWILWVTAFVTSRLLLWEVGCESVEKNHLCPRKLCSAFFSNCWIQELIQTIDDLVVQLWLHMVLAP
jgi:hypothetical protein